MTFDTQREHGTPASRLDLSPSRDTGNDLYEGNDRSNFVAFLLGGVVISGGLLAFLYYDSDNLAGRDIFTTGSVGRIEAPAVLPVTRGSEKGGPTTPR